MAHQQRLIALVRAASRAAAPGALSPTAVLEWQRCITDNMASTCLHVCQQGLIAAGCCCLLLGATLSAACKQSIVPGPQDKFVG